MFLTKNHFSITLAQRSEKRKDGKACIRILLSLNNKPFRFNTGIYCKPDHFNNQFQLVKGDPNSNLLNARLFEMTHELERVCLQLDKDGKLTPQNIKEILYPKKKESNFLFWFKDQFDSITEGMAAGTIRHYNTFYSKIREFQNPILFQDLSLEFLYRFEDFMKEKGNSTNTVANGHKFLKKLIGVAKRQGLVVSDPYENFKVKKEKTKKDHLSKLEIKAFIKEYNTTRNLKLKNTLRSFLFSVFTGLAYSEIYNLRWRDIQNDAIILERKKTGNPLFIPINDHARQFILEPDDPNKKVLGVVYSNQRLNDYLHAVTAKLNIEKKITFHSARHTFAIMNLHAGVPLPTVQNLLGHMDIKTTQIYLQQYNPEIASQAKKLNKIRF